MLAHPLRTGLYVATLLLSWAGSPVEATDAPSTSDLAELISRGVHGPEDRAEQALLGLRQLRDPSLRPFFAQMASGSRPDHRLHGVLGMAELENPPRIDLFLVARLDDPAEQVAALSAAQTHNMLPENAAKDILAREDVAPVVQAYLFIRLAAGGEAIDAARVRPLLGDESLITAARAALLLTAAGHTEEAAPILDRVLADASGRGSWRLAMLLDDVRSASMSACAPFVSRVVREREGETVLHAEALMTLLVLDPMVGAAAWIDAYSSITDLANRLRLALVAYEALPHTPGTVFETLAATRDNAILRAMGDAGLGVRAGGSQRIDAIRALIETAYAPAVGWVVNDTKDLPPHEASNVLQGVLDMLSRRETIGLELMDHAVLAASLLGKIDESAVDRQLRESVTDRREARRQALLLGMLRDSGSPRPDALDALLEAPDTESRALATILHALRTPALDEAQSQRLRRVAYGWGGLAPIRRTQAAWLVIRHSGQERAALARMYSPPNE